MMLFVDSADPEMIAEGIEAGWLPTLAGLRRRGVGTRLRTSIPAFEAATWVELTSGRPVAEHHAIAELRLRPGTYRLEPTPAEVREEPFWGRVSDAGLPSTVSGVYTVPIVPGLRGTQIAGWGAPARFRPARSEPPSALRELERAAGKWRERRREPPRTTRELRRERDRALDSLEQIGDGLVHLARDTEWRLFVGSFAPLHEAGHRLGRGTDMPPPLDHALADLYRAADRQVARVIDEASDAVVIALSPLGMTSAGAPRQATATVLRAGGWTVGSSVSDPALRRLSAGRAIARRLLPLPVRRLLGRRLPRDRWVATLTYADVDWGATRAFALPNHDGLGYIRLNVRGREPEGIVERGRDYDRCVADLTALFSELTGPEHEHLVTAVDRVDEMLGSPVEDVLPDLIVRWAPRARPFLSANIAGERVAIPMPEPRPGAHRNEGWLIAAGPGISLAQGEAIPATHDMQIDVAPTVLRMLGVPVPDGLRGTPIPGLADDRYHR